MIAKSEANNLTVCIALMLPLMFYEMMEKNIKESTCASTLSYSFIIIKGGGSWSGARSDCARDVTSGDGRLARRRALARTS